MKKQLKYATITAIALGSLGFGIVGQATKTGKTPSYIEFDKGNLSLVPINYTNPQAEGEGPIVPTMDFGKLKIGDNTAQTVKLVGAPGSLSEVLQATGVANYLGDGSGWMVTLSATDFEADKKPKLPSTTFSFEQLKATNVIGSKVIKNMSTNKKVLSGGVASPIFITEKGDEASGKFQFDYRSTTLQLSNVGAQTAKPGKYTAALTWNLSAQSNEGKGQKSALPLR